MRSFLGDTAVAASLLLASALTAACGGITLGEGGDIGPGGGGGQGGGTGAPANPLDGTWGLSVPSGTITATGHFTFNADRTLTISVESSDCTGTETVSGMTWTSTSSTLTVTGTEVCAGSLDCGGSTASCSSTVVGGVTDTACNYALSDGNNTLTLSACRDASGGTTSSVVVLIRE